MDTKEALNVLEMFLHKQCSLKRTEFAYDQITVWHAVNMATEALENSRWIPCSERLPEENGRYLVTFQERTIDICWFENKHFRIFGEIKDKFVSAWMELPKVYKSENS